jgi:hypothetical protein
MSAVAELARVGLKARVTEGRLQVGPPALMTPESRALVSRLADQLRAELTRYRAWTMHEADGRRIGVVLDSQGMTASEALASMPRPDLTVQPLLASRVER